MSYFVILNLGSPGSVIRHRIKVQGSLRPGDGVSEPSKRRRVGLQGLQMAMQLFHETLDLGVGVQLLNDRLAAVRHSK